MAIPETVSRKAFRMDVEQHIVELCLLHVMINPNITGTIAFLQLIKPSCYSMLIWYHIKHETHLNTKKNMWYRTFVFLAYNHTRLYIILHLYYMFEYENWTILTNEDSLAQF